MMMRSGIASSEKDVFLNFTRYFDITGKDILEVGGHMPVAWIQSYGENSWTAIDPRNHDERPTNHYRSIKGYAQLIPCADNAFDYIFSCNAFQHIHSFKMALKEMYRVLKPGGVLYANFGPIWSAPDGSHIENVCYKNKVYNFWETSLIPNWYHLVYSCRELFEILSSKLDAGLAKALAEYVFLSDWLNRLSYDEYWECIKNAGFGEVIYFGAATEFGYNQNQILYENKYQIKYDKWMKKNSSLLEQYQNRDLKICLRK